jgi:transcription initiation factor TFIIB
MLSNTKNNNTNNAKNNNNNNNNESKKKKHTLSNKKMWNMFDSELDTKKEALECIYRSCGNREICDACNEKLLLSEDGFLTCVNSKCGIIYKDMVDQSAEWRYYGSNDNNATDPTRCGMPINPLLEESSYGCRVLCDGYKMTYEMRKIKRYTDWQSMPHKEKSQYEEFQTITILAQNASIPKMIIDDAIRYHKKISDYNLNFRGDNRDGIIAGSIYVSCRIHNYPRTAKEIATIFNLNVASAIKGCKNALSIINELERNMNNNEKTIFCQPKPESFIERFCSKLNINTELTKLCQFISLKIVKMGEMSENTPPSIAAGVIYFISQFCNLNINKKDIKIVSEISEVTINKCFKKLEKLQTQLLPESIVKKYLINVIQPI